MFTIPLPITSNVFPYLRPLLQSGAVVVPNVVSVQWVTICSEQMANGERGVLSGIGIDVNNNGSDYEWQIGSLAFRLMVAGGSPIEWGPFTTKRGSVENPTNTMIMVQPGALIMLQARRTSILDSGARTIYGLFTGVRWPITVDRKPKPTETHLTPDILNAMF